MKKLIPLAIIAVLFAIGSVAHPMQHGDRGDRFAEKLGLTDDQRASVEAIMESHRGRRNELSALDKEQRHAAKQLMKQDIRSDLSTVLTPEQLAKFDEMQANRAKRGGKQRLAEKLELTDDQRASVEAIMESRRESLKDLRGLDRQQAHDARQLIHQDIRSDLSAVLSPEQLAKFDEMHATRGKQHRKLHKRHSETDTL